MIRTRKLPFLLAGLLAAAASLLTPAAWSQQADAATPAAPPASTAGAAPTAATTPAVTAAATGAQAATATTPASAPSAAEAKQMTCRTVRITGSNLRTRKVCSTPNSQQNSGDWVRDQQDRGAIGASAVVNSGG